METISGDIPKEKLIEKLIEGELNRGYIPREIIYRSNVKHYERFETTDIVTCQSGFAGKKQARILYEKNKDIFYER